MTDQHLLLYTIDLTVV